ncbi:MAG: DNA topoisomerase 3 [Muribaculaceae bacterium]|nr:DNA topoisomerase 3 [Muribaculaceae bacterium]
MKVCITEKPSVARDIANILGATARRDGYFEGREVCVTWTFGHLCCLKEPQDYTENWKHWSLASLPMIPPRFGIKLIKDKGIEKQFKVIKTLVEKADEVINCGDAGQEGELIQRWVMQKAGVKCPVRRLWISSLTDESIRQGFKDLKPEGDYKTLYEAGLSRAIGDWLLGLNATRLYTLKYGVQGTVLSVGRVQTPTLALIVERHRQILNFVPQDYWELKTLYRNVTFSAKAGKFDKEEEAKKVLDQIKSKPFTILDITDKKGKESPPRLFDLTSLQVECNKKWGWSADETLRLIQSLYEKKVTTYPRVDTTYLSDDLYPKIPDILRKMSPYAPLTERLINTRLPKTKKVFDNTKVTDHHAIIPTGESPLVLVGNERQMYHLIARRFIAAFYPDCVFNTTTVIGETDGKEFKATGKTILDEGWRMVYTNESKTEQNEESEDREIILPQFVKGESGSHKPELVKKTTQPPKPYTEGTLLRAMEGAGKTIEDEELREAMKENGIGRPSTRSAIIETLFKRRYLTRERKNIHPTPAGIALIDTITTDLLKSARLTGIWENKLRRIERGTYQASEFIDEIKILLNEIVMGVMKDNSHTKILAPESDDKPKKRKNSAKSNQTGKRRSSDSANNESTDKI